nr:immunoglobulin heavy chain junction region [Macaca mulatta]MOY25520.1 immunoglobulin heavy chain junction region [Macaca mulatta]MOY25637.1 immunoglobulin heavy chain junction region [Macaca mulatta]MOY25699.1 immunoglobulin heavy chain junction region [Macaca mulatta]MOY26009.1 immunoglobulin heavy chain junction region [Macaca mulatta]
CCFGTDYGFDSW